MRSTSIALLLLAVSVGSPGSARAAPEGDLPALRIPDAAAPPAGPAVRTLRFDRDGTSSEAGANPGAEKAATVVLAADAEAPAAKGLDAAYARGVFRLFLAGHRPDGATACLPLWANSRTARAVGELGASVTPYDLVTGVGWEGVVVLRIERSGASVRYRWGHSYDLPRWHAPAKPWDEGDVTVPVKDVEAAGRGPLLPALAATFARREAVRARPATLVRLELTPDTRVVDLFRAVECAGGKRDVLFESFESRPRDGATLRAPVPAPEDYDFFARGTPGRPTGPTTVVNIRAVGAGEAPAYRIEGREVGLPGIPLGDGPLLVRVDEAIPFSFVLPLLDAARRAGTSVSFEFAYDADRFEEAAVEVPAPGAGAEGVDVPLAAATAPPAAVKGADVTLAIPKSAKSGPVLRAALHLLHAGARGIAFSSGS